MSTVGGEISVLGSISGSDSLFGDVRKAVMKHYDTLVPMNERLAGPLSNSIDDLTPLPTVFLLGNHSSGKSSFINYVLGRDVQNTGVAPTDDSFTVIVPGNVDVDQDGPSLVGSTDMGFSGLYVLCKL